MEREISYWNISKSPLSKFYWKYILGHFVLKIFIPYRYGRFYKFTCKSTVLTTLDQFLNLNSQNLDSNTKLREKSGTTWPTWAGPLA